VACLSPGGVKTSLTVSGFHRLERWKSCIMICEVAKSEIPNWRKVLGEAKLC
jgi:molybdopterin synthase catalytic subunit